MCYNSVGIELFAMIKDLRKVLAVNKSPQNARLESKTKGEDLPWKGSVEKRKYFS